MDDKKTTVTPQKTDVATQVDLVDKEPIAAAVDATPEPTAAAAIKSTSTRSKKLTIITLIIVAIALAGFVYALEKDGRLDTNIFGTVFEWQAARAPIAQVNGEDIGRDDFNQTVTQLQFGATQQGADVSNPEIQAAIRAQALELVIGAELFRQSAIDNGIEVSAEEIEARLDEIEAETGGPVVLAERMEEFGITAEMLAADVESELQITKLLDEVVLVDVDLTVSQEEIEAVYEAQGGEEAGLPPLAEIQDQIELQLSQAKEQQLIDVYITTLRQDADIVVN